MRLNAFGILSPLTISDIFILESQMIAIFIILPNVPENRNTIRLFMYVLMYQLKGVVMT